MSETTAAPRTPSTNRVAIAPIEPIAVGADDAAALVGIGVTLFRELDSSARTPTPIPLGKRRLWSLADLRLWIELGCPDRERFQILKKARGQ